MSLSCLGSTFHVIGYVFSIARASESVPEMLWTWAGPEFRVYARFIPCLYIQIFLGQRRTIAVGVC
jgi:hypothetical protein